MGLNPLTTRACRMCKEQIQFDAKICPHCRTENPVEASGIEHQVKGWGALLATGVMIWFVWQHVASGGCLGH